MVYKHNVTIENKNTKSVTFTIPASFTHEISLAMWVVPSRKTLTFNGARFGLLASRHLRIKSNILLSLTDVLSSPRNIDRSRADTCEISSLCLLQCGNFGLASPEAFKGRESTAKEMDIPMIKLLQPVDLTNNLRLFPCSRSERSFVPP